MNIIEEKWDSVVDTLSTEFGFSPISINTWIKPLQVQRYDSGLIQEIGRARRHSFYLCPD